MKKLILLLSLFAIATLPLQAQNTITFDDQGYGNAQDLDNFTLTSNSQGFRFKCFSSSPGFEYRSTSNFCSYTGGAPVGTGSAQSAMTIATTDGAEIDLSSIDIINEFVCFSCCTLTVTLTGYKDGSAVSGATYTASNTGLSTTFDVSGDSDFDAIDSLRITASGGDLTGTLIDNIVWDAGSVSCSMTASMTSVNNVDCNGGSDGSLTVTQSSGTANFSYAWSNGATTSGSSASTNTITSLAAGTYTVTVTDNSGCTATASATVSQPGSPTVASAAVTSALDCNGDTDGQVTASATGGTTPYTYSWNTGETSAVETNLGAGTYSVTITDQNGCTDSASVTMTQPTALVASSAVTSALDCNGDTDGQVTASASGGTTPYTYSWNTGGTSALETGLAAGTYSVTITDQNGCTDSASVTMTQPTALVASSAVTSALDCNGDTDGQVTASATGGTTPYTYSWNTGGTSALETGLAAGTYSVTITDQNGCTDSASVTMTQPTALVASSAVTSALDCNGDTDGQVTASATGGTTPYTYSWNTGETSAVETNLGAGTYSVTITDQNGCTDSASVTMTQPTALVASSAVTSALDCNGDTDGQVTASATGGTTPYTYAWNTGGTSALETGLAAGTYSVTITDQNGCTDSASVTMTQPTAFVASSAVTSALDCNGDTDGQVTASASGGTTPYTYSWNTGGTSALETGLAAGTYSVTITDQNGCTDSASVTMTQPTALVASSAVTSALDCNGDTDGQVTASASGGTTPYTYAWNTGGTSALETGLAAGTYSVTITDQNGCTDSASVTMTQPTALVASSAVTSALDCNGDTDGQVTASASGGTTPYTYSWNTGGTSALETGLAAGTYSVTITDQNGCTDSASVTMTQPTAIVASAVVDSNSTCGAADGGATASGTGGTGAYTYSWSNSATTASITGVVAGTYSVTITDANGCTDSASVAVIDAGGVNASAAVTSTLDCNGDTDGQVTASATGGTTPYTYAWNTGGTSALETGLAAGTYSVTITDQSGCTDSASVTMTQPTALVASSAVTSALDCNGDTDGQVTASATGGTTPYTYAWNTGGTSALETGLAAGTYSVTITDQNGCTDSASVTMTQPTALVASSAVTSALDCNGDTDGQVTASASGGTTPYTYAWNTGGTSALETGLAAGTYSVTITDQNGCTDSASVTMTQPTALVASSAVTSALDCNGDTDGQVTASASGGTTPYTYAWNTGGTSALETGLAAGTYSVTITDQNGCTDSASVTMAQPTALVASSAVTSALDCNGDTDGQVTASASGGTTPYTYAWNTGGTSALETGLAAGTYSVTITDQNGCTDSASVTMTQPTALVASSAVTSALDCNGDTDGQVTASATGGTTPYTYSWNTGGTSALETGLAAGTYSVTITDQNGCTDSASVTMTQPSALVASSAVTSALDCNGDTDGQVTASATGGTTPYTYSWNTGGTSALETGLGAGTYSVTITDQNGCTDSASVTLSQPTVLVASAAVSSNYNSSNISCNGASDGEAMATATGGTGSYTYSWNTGGTSVFESGLSAGTYSVTITDANGCTDSASITITEPTAISLSTTDTSVTCTGDSDGAIALTASGGTGTLSFLWSSGSTAQNLSGIAGGTYTVTVTDVNGCTETTSDVVNEAVSLLSLTSSVTNVTCNGESDGAVDLTVSGGQPNFTYLWSTGSTAQDISNRPAGTYTVTVTDDYGCEKTTNATVTEPAVLAPGTISTN